MPQKNTLTSRPDDQTYNRVMEIVNASGDLKITRDECVTVVLKAFFTATHQPKDIEKIRELVILMRKGRF